MVEEEEEEEEEEDEDEGGKRKRQRVAGGGGPLVGWPGGGGVGTKSGVTEFFFAGDEITGQLAILLKICQVPPEETASPLLFRRSSSSKLRRRKKLFLPSSLTQSYCPPPPELSFNPVELYSCDIFLFSFFFFPSSSIFSDFHSFVRSFVRSIRGDG